MGTLTAQQVFDSLTAATEKAFRVLRTATQTRFEGLEQRIATLEQVPVQTMADSYEGVHLHAKQYHRGALVTHGNSLWLCLARTTETPGTAQAWKLIVKGAK